MHGGEFIQYALRMGAAAVLTDAEGAALAESELASSEAALVVVEDPRQALACTAALWFGAQPGVMAAVDRHQRQDLGRHLPAPDLGRAGT